MFYYKKILLGELLLTTLSLLLLTACRNENVQSNQADDEYIIESVTVETNTDSVEQYTEYQEFDEQRELILNEPLEVGAYTVEITNLDILEENGKRALRIRLNWTNNSKETTSALSTIEFQAFQDKIEIVDRAHWDSIDLKQSYTNARPTGQIDGVEFAFIIEDISKPIELEMTANNSYNTSNNFKYFTTIDLNKLN